MKQFESFALDTSNECLWRNGTQITLPPKPFAVLRYLVENPARLITHDELLDALWPETYVQPQVLRTYMLDLRKLLGDDAGEPRFIQTVPKRGYTFIAAVKEAAKLNAITTARPIVATPESDGIVGREQELERLEAHAQFVAQSQRQIVFLTGGSGIGKTALADTFCTQITATLPARVARGQCVEGLGKDCYYPVIEAVSQLCASSDGERACQVLAKMAPAWLPAIRQEFAPAIAQPDRDRTPGDLCAALEELARETPLIFVFEDLHWADGATIQLISAIARRRAPTQLMVVGTYRPLHGSTEHPLEFLKQDLVIRRLCTEIALGPLAKTAIRQLLQRELNQHPLPPGLDTYIYQHSEGSPLFVLALLQHLLAKQFLIRKGTHDGAHWEQSAPFPELETGVPDELAKLIELEIERLDSQDQRILEAASLMTIAFPAWAVAAALERDPIEIEEACDELAKRLRFVHRAGHDDLPDGTRSDFYVFAHGLYREVLYQKQSASRRSKGHIRIAERLAELFAGRKGDVAREIAMHFEAAGHWQAATHMLRFAAQHARARHSYSECRQLLEHALGLAENLGESARATEVREIRAEMGKFCEAVESFNSCS